MRTRPRTLVAVLTAVALALVPATGAADAPDLDHVPIVGDDSPHIVTATGQTTIRASGSGGVDLRLPADTRLDPEHVELTLTGGRFAFVGLVDLRKLGTPSVGGDPGMRMERIVRLIPEFSARHDKFNFEDRPLMEAGRWQVYVITDGEVEVTYNFPDLADATPIAIDAAGVLDVVLEELPREPIAGTNFFGGGRSHEVRAPGYAVLSAWTRGDEDMEIGGGSRWVRPCLDPAVGPGDGTEHEHGCELNDVVLLDMALVSAASATGQARRRSQLNPTPDGDVYAGWIGHQHEVAGEGVARAMAFWLNAGITYDD